MRLPEMTIFQMMVGVAAMAVWMAIIRWGLVDPVLGASALMCIPAYLWRAAGGKIGVKSEPCDKAEGRNGLFLWAWALGTIAVAAMFYLAAFLMG